MAAPKADSLEHHHRCAQRGAAHPEYRRHRWKLTQQQIAELDRASDVPPAYPVWHQRGFPMLNERG
jgi:hypothetical protein